MSEMAKPVGKQQEELFEWIYDETKKSWLKITDKNSNGRICIKCNYSCPCSCKCCQPFCCSFTKKYKSGEQ